MPAKPPLPLYITGPTASGKSAAALQLAELTGGEIVCADAFQLYRGIPLLTAQPTPEELGRVPHHLYGSIPLSSEMDAGRFERLALETIREIQSRGRLAIICGGSGLYIKALTHGLSPLPPGDPALRRELELLSPEELADRLTELDPASARQLNLQNPRHVARALEICLLTGQPASGLKQSWTMPRPGVRGVFIDWPREILYERINARTHAMAAAGAVAEAAAVDPADLSNTASKVIGLWDFRAVADEALSLPEAVAAVQQHTRHYAKRQTAWFKRESSFVHLPAGPFDTLTDLAEKTARIFGLRKPSS